MSNVKTIAGERSRWSRYLSATGIFAAVFCLCLAAVVSPFLAEMPVGQAADSLLSGQSTHLARAGLDEARYWLRRQPEQPVRKFRPSRADSEDAELGLVREFGIADGVWGRFEVWRDPARSFAGAVAPVAEDISGQYGHPVGSGQVWRLRSIGYTYRLVDAQRRFDQAPNLLLSRQVLQTTVGRLRLRLPGHAALCLRQPDKLHLSGSAQIRGGAHAVGILHPEVSVPLDLDGGIVRGTSPLVAMSTEHYADGVEAVFGVNESTLLTMADQSITDPDLLPSPLLDGALTCVRAKQLTFTADRPLRGVGVLYVHGDVLIEPGSAARFRGLLYVDGKLSIHGPADLRGTVMVTGETRIHGGPGVTVLRYDDSILRTVRGMVCTYRTLIAAHRPAN